MLTQSRRRIRPEVVWALALVLGAPAFVQAQQTGLFPSRTIRRERVASPLEDPVYAQYRNQYYGYFPTCWHRFPPGWGCPSAEAPDAAKSFQELKLQKVPAERPQDGDNAPGMDNEPLPGERGPAPATDLNALPPLPRNDTTPFNLDNNPPPGNRPAAPAPSTPGAGAPRSDATERSAAPPLASLPAPSEAPPNDGAGEPLLALPEPTAPVPAAPGPETAPTPGPSVPTDPAATPAANIPAQAPQRRSLIGGLLSGLGLKRR